MRAKLSLLLITFALQTPCFSAEVVVDAEELKDFSELTGVGCLVKDDKDGITAIVCKSKRSAEFAWNAVLARSKFRCQAEGKPNINMLFLRPPSLPVENGVYTAQMDIRCSGS